MGRRIAVVTLRSRRRPGGAADMTDIVSVSRLLRPEHAQGAKDGDQQTATPTGCGWGW